MGEEGSAEDGELAHGMDDRGAGMLSDYEMELSFVLQKAVNAINISAQAAEKGETALASRYQRIAHNYSTQALQLLAFIQGEEFADDFEPSLIDRDGYPFK